jgi:copper chaperone NosL
MKKMSTTSRIIVAIAALALIATYFLPVWAIYLIAPQYPEGLAMQIWLNRLSGDVEIINGLNHYIGMKHIKEEMFPEFKFLPYIIAFFVAYGIAVAISGSKKFLGSYCILLIVFAIAALIDFYMWGYDYGQNLDPHAAIQVPGLSYQPPVIGHKKLLNFDAFSYPDTGGWIVIGAGVVLMLTWFLEWRKAKKASAMNKKSNIATVTTGVAACLFLAGCNPKAEPINYGKDNCSECNMTIMDPKFGGEIVTKKGKVFKFDDAHCMAIFLKDRKVDLDNLHKLYFTDYNGGKEFLDTKTSTFVLGSQLKSPMGSNAAAFSSKGAAEKKASEINGKTTDWATLYNVLIR